MSVVAAFEVELYLKCILTDLGYPVPNLHDLKKLYDAIPKSEKAKIQKRFDSDPQQVAKALSVRMGLLAPEVVGLDAQLTICADAFEAWRYHFENPTRKLPVNNFSCLNFVLRGFILERHPDWGVDEDLYYESTCPAQ